MDHIVEHICMILCSTSADYLYTTTVYLAEVILVCVFTDVRNQCNK